MDSKLLPGCLHFLLIQSNQDGIISILQVGNSPLTNENTNSPMFYSLQNYVLSTDVYQTTECHMQ